MPTARNRVVPRDELAATTQELALRIAEVPCLGLALTKRAVHGAEDLQGLHDGPDPAFGLHHLAHAPNTETARDSFGGMNIATTKRAGA